RDLLTSPDIGPTPGPLNEPAAGEPSPVPLVRRVPPTHQGCSTGSAGTSGPIKFADPPLTSGDTPRRGTGQSNSNRHRKTKRRVPESARSLPGVRQIGVSGGGGKA